MKFIDDAKGAWSHYSTIALSAAGGLQGGWISIPDEIKTGLPEIVGRAVSWVCLVIVLLGLFGKFVKQPEIQTPPDVTP